MFNCAEIGLSHCQDHQHGTGDWALCCHGTGNILVTGLSVVMAPVSEWSQYSRCHGTGEILVTGLSVAMAPVSEWSQYSRCHGTGVILITLLWFLWYRVQPDQISSLSFRDHTGHCFFRVITQCCCPQTLVCGLIRYSYTSWYVFSFFGDTFYNNVCSYYVFHNHIVCMHINGQLQVQTCGAQFKRCGVPPGIYMHGSTNV